MSSARDGVAIVWFRQDLRLADNPALVEACRQCDRIVPIFIDDSTPGTASRIGEASRVWLHHSLLSLDASLREHGNRLLCRQGDPLAVLRKLARQTGAKRIFWNRCHDPVTIARDTKIKAALKAFEAKTFNGLLVNEPWGVTKKDGTPYRVYTPYWRAAARLLDETPEHYVPCEAPDAIPGLDDPDALTGSVDDLALLPARDWHADMMAHWSVGEVAASQRLDDFLAEHVAGYDDARNLPAQPATSRMSPHLHHGEISPRQILARLFKGRDVESLGEGETTFAKEVFWREFGYSLLYHFPDTLEEPLDRRFRVFPWAADDAMLKAWQSGQTGVPIVDAGMRELYATGWMHNRVRMIVASFLIKNLLQPWQHGENWFRDCLVDADLASNAMGWQWTAGCGADAAPFFRVFNPVLQGEKFDKAGDYVRRWVPELAKVAQRHVHKPWELPDTERALLDYPAPLVDLGTSRRRALDAFSAIKGK